MAKKILTQSTVATDNIQSQPDQVTNQASALKKSFDQGDIDNKAYINNTHLPELQSETLNDSGGHAIGLGVTGISANNVADGIKEVKDALDGVVLGQIPDGSLTKVKLNTALQSEIDQTTKRSILNTLRVQELEINAAVSSKFKNSTDTFYDYKDSDQRYSIGSVDQAKAFAQTVTQGTNTITFDTLQKAKDGTTPTNLSDSFVKGDEITLQDAIGITNIVTNGDFGDGTTGWLSTGVSNFSVISNIASFTASTQYGRIFQEMIFNGVDKWFFFSSVKADSPLVQIVAYEVGGGTFSKSHTGSGEFENLSLIAIPTNAGGSQSFRIWDVRSSGWTPVEIDGNTGVFAINMTALGIEDKTEAQMLELVQKGYFESTSLTQKESLTVSNVNDGTKTLTFTTNIQNAYPSGANVYRSNLSDDWGFGGFDAIIPNPNYNTWDENKATPISEWQYNSGLNEFMYCKSLSSPFRPLRYDTINDVWKNDLNAPSGSWVFMCFIGTDMYVRKGSDGTIWKYDTLLDSWDETLSAASGVWKDPVPIGTDIYVRQQNSPYQMWKYDTLLDTWDETLATPPFEIDFAVSDGVDIWAKESFGNFRYVKYDVSGDSFNFTSSNAPENHLYSVYYDGALWSSTQASPYEIMRYDIGLDSWDNTFANPSGNYSFLTLVQDKIYVKDSAVFKPWSYDPRLLTEGIIPLTDIDVRLNIEPLQNDTVTTIQAWSLLTDITGVTNTGFLSIVEELDNESYVALVNTDLDLGSDREYFSTGQVSTPNEKVTYKANMTRLLTTDNVTVEYIYGGVV